MQLLAKSKHFATLLNDYNDILLYGSCTRIGTQEKQSLSKYGELKRCLFQFHKFSSTNGTSIS